VLTEPERELVRRRLRAGERKEVLAVEYGVHFNTIGNIGKEEGQPLVDQATPVHTTSANRRKSTQKPTKASPQGAEGTSTKSA
jgi:hypothetical protein